MLLHKKWHVMLLIAFSTLIAQDIKGEVFFDYTDSGDSSKVDEFALKRVYLTFSKSISDELSVTIQTDVDTNSSPKNIYLKNAKVDWKTLDGNIVIGLQGMNMFKVQEGNWGKRYLDKTIMDRFKYSSAADMGIGYYHSKDKFHGSLLMTNGAGYKKSENDSHKKLSLQFIYGNTNLSKSDGFNVGAVLSHEPYDRDGEVGIPEEPIGEHTKKVFGLFGGYAKNNLRVGVEWNQLEDSGLLDGNYDNNLTSVYCTYVLNPKQTLVVKHDMVSGNKDANYAVVAMEFAPTKGLVVAPNVRSNDGTTMLGVNFQFQF
jgi:hypothetical protein|tara:strand:- start:278 stop:1222 length:945 start_codon:yes stop_codon:yes gene_type:complete